MNFYEENFIGVLVFRKNVCIPFIKYKKDWIKRAKILSREHCK